MNRELKAKQRSCYKVTGISQSFALGTGPETSAAPVLTATPQKAVMLGVLDFQADQLAMIDEITVQGESLMVSDASAPSEMFNRNVTDAKEIYAGFTLDGGKSAVIKASLNASGESSICWFCDPIDKALPNEQEREFSNWVFGLGKSNSIAAGASDTIAGVANRPCTLGKIVLANHSTTAITDEKLFVTSIKVAGDEILAGDGTQEIPLTSLFGSSQAGAGLDLNYKIPYNAAVVITIKNRDTTLAGVVAGGIYCRA